MKRNPFRHAMTYGLILGCCFSANFVLSVVATPLAGVLSYILLACILYLTFRFTCHYRDHECDGVLSYGQSLSYILLLFFFSAIVASLIKIIYFKFINPNYLQMQLEQALDLLEKMKFPISDDMTAQMDSLMQPVTFALQSIWIDTLGGLFAGLFVSFFTKKGPKPLEP